MQKSSSGDNNFDEARQGGDRDHVIGDADNVQKTSYVVGHGTDPSARGPDAGQHRGDGPRRGADDLGYNAAVRTGGGLNLGLIVVVVIAVAIALVYGFGVLG